MNPFWQSTPPAGAPAVVEIATGRTLTYGALAAEADALAASLCRPDGRNLVFLFARNDLASLAAYLGALRAGLAVALLPAGNPPLAAALIATYAPDRIVTPAGFPDFAGYVLCEQTAGLAIRRPAAATAPTVLHPDLTLLLPTSGTTGSPKLVRLSARNLDSNARAIAGYLGLTPAERAPTSLPLSYSYGLSIVHSHLVARATLLLGDFPVVQRETWATLQREGATSFAGVPMTYQLLHRLRFDPYSQPALRTYTQAGGRLDAGTKRWFLDAAEPTGARFFVMYGQTEAAPRISYVPPERLREKPDSIGRAIPNGELSLDPETHELLYRGPNVMLGYAESRPELALGDTTGGLLRTGDLARRDADGYFSITGRLKRFLKLAGLRVSLDELERHLETLLQAPVACGGCDEALVVHTEAAITPERIPLLLQERFGLVPSLVRAHTAAPLARLPTGKIDYSALKHA